MHQENVEVQKNERELGRGLKFMLGGFVLLIHSIKFAKNLLPTKPCKATTVTFPFFAQNFYFLLSRVGLMSVNCCSKSRDPGLKLFQFTLKADLLRPPQVYPASPRSRQNKKVAIVNIHGALSGETEQAHSCRFLGCFARILSACRSPKMKRKESFLVYFLKL